MNSNEAVFKSMIQQTYNHADASVADSESELRNWIDDNRDNMPESVRAFVLTSFNLAVRNNALGQRKADGVY